MTRKNPKTSWYYQYKKADRNLLFLFYPQCDQQYQNIESWKEDEVLNRVDKGLGLDLLLLKSSEILDKGQGQDKSKKGPERQESKDDIDQPHEPRQDAQDRVEEKAGLWLQIVKQSIAMIAQILLIITNIIGQHDGRDQTDKGDGHEENLHCLSEIPINVDDTLTQWPSGHQKVRRWLDMDRKEKDSKTHGDSWEDLPQRQAGQGHGTKGVKNPNQETDHAHGQEGKVRSPYQDQGKENGNGQEGQNNDNHLLKIKVMFAQDILLLLVFLIYCLMVIHGVVNGRCTHIKALITAMTKRRVLSQLSCW